MAKHTHTHTLTMKIKLNAIFIKVHNGFWLCTNENIMDIISRPFEKTESVSSKVIRRFMLIHAFLWPSNKSSIYTLLVYHAENDR